MRKLALFAGGFSAAVFLWRYGLWPFAALVGILCLMGAGVDKSRRLRWILPLAGLVTALLWCALFQWVTIGPWEARHKEKDLLLTARIDDIPYQNDRGLWVTDARFADPETGKKVDGILYLPGNVEVRPGEELDVIGTLYLADRVGEEEITYFSSKGSFIRFYASDTALRKEAVTTSARYWPMLFAGRVRERIAELLNEETAPLAAALVLGEKSGLDSYF